MNWKEMINQEDAFLDDPRNAKEFSLKGHPEYPFLSQLDEEEVLEILSEFLEAEGQIVSIKNLLQYAPIFEITLHRKNLPSIYG
ncbi:hypothetical protein LPTSP4_34400 [Leptospira ryugenii]|uniref:Uncharacterized protein n=1 Tax=Leptospira ryugenii TaxID=1917863 RepID=A0A2P2E4W0_9LEPT|nr:hypothetical protein [Leptospira ryugenii]GBF51902.1 hypothetical protein LPTSP4_34400 [Leptospira ryugenii]